MDNFYLIRIKANVIIDDILVQFSVFSRACVSVTETASQVACSLSFSHSESSHCWDSVGCCKCSPNCVLIMHLGAHSPPELCFLRQDQ